MRHEIYKDHYEFEWEHRSYLARSLNVPIAVSTIIGSAAAVMVKQFPYRSDLTSWIFVALVVISVASIALGAFFLFCAFVGYEYKRVPTPLALKHHYDSLVEWHKRYGEGKSTADAKFEESFNIRLGEATEVNAANNKRKSGYLYRCNAVLGISVVFLAFASIPYLYAEIMQKNALCDVKSLNLQKKLNEVNSMSDPDKDEPNEDEDRPVEPTMPPNEDIREHNVKPHLDRSSGEDDDQ